MVLGVEEKLHRLSPNQLRALFLLAKNSKGIISSSASSANIGKKGKALGGVFSSLARQAINKKRLVMPWGKAENGHGLRWKLNTELISKTELLKITSRLLLVLMIFLFFRTNKIIATSTYTITNRADFDLGYYNNTEAKSKEGALNLTSAGSWGPRSWRTPNLTTGDQAAIASDGNYIYLLHNADNHFVRYLPAENRWQTLAPAPHYAYPGANLVFLGNYIYAVFGGYQREFSRYSIINNTWTDLNNAPDLMYGGSVLVTDGTNIYCLRGTATTDFWKYTVATGVWSTLTGPAATISYGAGAAYYDGNIYALRGSNTTTMYRYNILSGNWYTTTTGAVALSAVPGALNDDHTITIKNNIIYVTRENSNAFYSYNITTNTWATLSLLPQTSRYVGAVYNSSEDYIYVFRGNSTYDFWKYNPTSGLFLGIPDMLNPPTTGADIIYQNGNLYYTRGNAGAQFYRYNIVGGTWYAGTNSPVTFAAYDTKGTAAGNYLYFFNGNTQNLYRYEPAAEGGTPWTLASSTVPAATGHGAALVYPGSGNYIYATRGAGTRAFWRFDMVGAGGSWSDAAAADLPDNAEANAGARLVSDGVNIYYISGVGTQSLLKYTIGTDSWSVVSNLPFAPYYGTDAVYYNGKIYFQAGNYKNDFWEYTIASNTWRKLPDVESNYAYDIGPYYGASLEVDSTTGVMYSNAGNPTGGSGTGLIWLHTYTPSALNYASSGTWTSNSINLSYVSGWNSVDIGASTPDTSSVSIQTRSSGDNVVWSSWQDLSENNIQSPTAPYLQIKANLVSVAGMTAPILYSININYTGDETAPSNPTTFTGLSQAIGGVSINTGGTYIYTNPYISWSGATDGQTSIAGYYVYFGTEDSADPYNDGNYQTSTNYTVTTPLSTGKYYLRIKTKDTAGNISSAITGFVYIFNGVSPPTTLIQTSTEDFGVGSTSNISISGDKIKLQNKSGFWQQERLSLITAGPSYGSDFAYVASSNKLYVMRGSNTTTFYEYDIATDTWSTKAVTPAAVYYGADLVEGPTGYLYAFRGNNTNSFWRYDIGANTWSDGAAADFPYTVYYGGSLVYDGSRYIYGLRGNTDDAFYRYDTQNDNWEQMANTDFGSPERQIANTVYVGGDLTYDGADTIYAIMGNTRTGFASYSISQNTWTPLTNVPALVYDGAQIDYDSTTNAVYFTPGWSKTLFFKYDVGSGIWSSLAEVPASVSAGAAMRIINGNIYLLRGGGNQQFYKYNITNNSWLIPTVNLFGGWFRGTEYRTYGYGADIVKGDGNYYYLTRGNYDNLFVRYNASTGEVVKLADALAGFERGAELVYDSVNNKIYATSNVYFRKFYQYDIATDTWTEMTLDPPPLDSYNGSAMVFDGSRYIYWIRGSDTQSFYRYDTSSSTPDGSRWSAALTNTGFNMGYGADLVFKNNIIYALQGGNTVKFIRYDTSLGIGGTWNDALAADLPSGALVYNDGFLVDGGGDYLYACRGGNSNVCYRYSISGNTWTAIANAPANISTGGAAASNGSDKIFVIAGPGTNTFSNGLYTYVIQSDNSSFESTGSFTSAVHDLGSAYRFANIGISYTTALNNTLTVSTRTSADNNIWSSWSTATEEKTTGGIKNFKISSTANKYLQVKLDLTSSDGVYSGVVNDYTINYYSDTTAPTNPTLLTSTLGVGSTATITSGTWYNSATPYFVWPAAELTGGATDGAGGSGVDGYYVYWGNLASGTVAFTPGNLQVGSTYAPTITENGTYYLRIIAKDDAENTAATWWDAFTYKYDGRKPTTPSTLNVSPSSYTSNNNFSFTWSGASDSDSGVESYCYRTSGSEESCSNGENTYESDEICTTQTTISAITAGCAGTNTFSVRTKDKAGNYSSTYKEASFYYTTDAPGSPSNVRVTDPIGTEPVHNTLNWFAFAWDAPNTFKGEQSNLRYYYSFNSLPTASNVNEIGLSVTYLAAAAYDNVQKGENVFYVVAKDEAGNINYKNYGHVHFYADTTAPDAPENLDISDVSIKETSSWRLALSWDAPIASGSGVANYKVYRSATTGASCTTNFADFSYVASTSQTSYVDTGLTQSTKYYCLKACDSTNECSSVSDTVSFYPDGKWKAAPTLVASPSATVKTKSATVVWSTNRTSNSFVKYGKSSGTYGAEVGSSTQVSSHSITITGLDPGVTYYYKTFWSDEDGNMGNSSELSFTTNPAPFVSSVKVSNISIYSAYVNLTVKNAIKATVKYGKTLSYGNNESISTSKSESTYTVALTNLLEGTVYHLQIDAEDEEGNIFSGDDYSFETLPVPKIKNLKVQQVAGMPTATLRLLWETNALTSSIVTYYPSNNAERTLDSISLVLTKKHEVILKNLSDDTEYIFIVKGKDSANNETVPEKKNIKTSNDLRPPEISNMNVESTITGVGDEAKAQISISWDTDEVSSTQVEYAQGTGTAYGQTTQEDAAMTLNHSVIIPGLSPARIYHLRAISKDKSNNAGMSFDTVVVTPKSTKDALNLVIDNLSKTFGFLKGKTIK